MGTQAYWLKSGWRMVRLDEDGDRCTPQHCATLGDVREEASLNLVMGEAALVERYNKRAECFEPYGEVIKERTKPNHPRDFTWRVVVRRGPSPW